MNIALKTKNKLNKIFHFSEFSKDVNTFKNNLYKLVTDFELGGLLQNHFRTCGHVLLDEQADQLYKHDRIRQLFYGLQIYLEAFKVVYLSHTKLYKMNLKWYSFQEKPHPVDDHVGHATV